MYIDLSFIFNIIIVGVNIAMARRYGGSMHYTQIVNSTGQVLAEWLSFSPRDEEKTSRVADSLAHTSLVEYGIHRPDLERTEPSPNIPWKGIKHAQK